MTTGESRASLWLWGAVAAVLLAGARVVSGSLPSPLPPFQRPVMERYALGDTTAVLVGARRFGADLAFLQLLQYYAEEEPAEKKQAHEEAHAHGGHGHWHMGAEEKHADQIPGRRLTGFSELKSYAERQTALDPYFHYGNLFAAGALAFNLNRDDEALEILQKGTQADPSFWRYRLYAGAIAFRKSAKAEKVIAFLEEAMRYPDCPSMLQNILANLHRKQGNHRRAAEIYLHLVETSRDADYADLARKKLLEMKAQGLP